MTRGVDLAEIWDASTATHRGPNHPQNQDAFSAWREAGLFAVADGMGGHADGDLASQSIVEILRAVLEPGAALAIRVALAEEAIEAVNGALCAKAASSQHKDIIGSTVALALVDEGMAVGLWVGDSRVYRFSDGRLSQLTRDHSLTEDDAPGGGNVLTRAVGSAAHVEIERIVTEIMPGDTLLVCSDGLNKALSDEAIAQFLNEPLSGLAERLVARAIANGGRDDITAVVARCR